MKTDRGAPTKARASERPLWVLEMHRLLSKKPNHEAPLRLVSEHGMRLVPPGPAWREGMAKRKTDAAYRGAPDDVRSMENVRVIRTGSKRIVLKAIYYECKAGRLEKFERDGRTWLRATDLAKKFLANYDNDSSNGD